MALIYLLVFILIHALAIATARVRENPWKYHSECEPVPIAECTALGLNNFTTFPNYFHDHEGERDANEAVDLFKSFRHIFSNQTDNLRCARLLRPFLCLTLFPVCDSETFMPVLPCATVCLDVKKACGDTFHRLNFPWPRRFDCSVLTPYSSHEHLCVASLGITAESREEPVASTPPTVPEPVLHRFTCYEHNAAKIGTMVLAAIAFILSSFTTATFLISFRRRFLYPERPVPMMGLCYLFISAAYLMNFILAPDSTCGGTNNTLTRMENHPLCFMQSALITFFENAVHFWWMFSALSWWLTVSRGWSAEAFQRISILYHFIAWGSSGSICLVAVLLRKIDQDELSGVCPVGNGDKAAFMLMVIAPRLFCLFIGGCFSIASITGSVSLRRLLKNNPLASCSCTVKTDILLWKFGLFSGFYILTLAAFCSTGLVLVLSDDGSQVPHTISYVRTFLTLGSSVSVFGWVANSKTFTDWKAVCRKMFARLPKSADCCDIQEESTPLNKAETSVMSPPTSILHWTSTIQRQ